MRSREVISKEHVEAMYPLSPLQEGILFESVYAPESAPYVVQCSYGLHGRLNGPVFRHALEKVTKRHAVLRMAFV